MNHSYNTPIGRLRLIGYLEGTSLLILTFLAVPLKHLYHDNRLVETLGPIHGALFLLYLYSAISVGITERWRFKQTTWKVLLSCIIPFGTFYIDRYLLKKMADRNQ